MSSKYKIRCTPRLNRKTTVCIIYFNDLFSSLLDSFMFSDGTNLFYWHQDIKVLFWIANSKPKKVCDWFNDNKLSLNEKKTKYIFFIDIQIGMIYL